MSEELKQELRGLTEQELWERLEGGLFSLFDSDEEFDELLRVAAALGIKDFVHNGIEARDREEIYALFEDGEQLISEFIQFAVDKGLLTETDEDEEE